MPIYEYICLQCKEKFSLLRSIKASESDIKCPECSSGKIKKVLSAFACAAGTGSGGSCSSSPRHSHGGG